MQAWFMRTTVTLDPDVKAAVDQLRARDRLGLSEALNTLVRRGVAHREPNPPFVQRTVSGAYLLDITKTSAVLDHLDQAEGR